MINMCDWSSYVSSSYPLTYTALANGTISGASPQTVNYGASGTLVTAVPNTRYHFVSWSAGILTASRPGSHRTAQISLPPSLPTQPPHPTLTRPPPTTTPPPSPPT